VIRTAELIATGSDDTMALSWDGSIHVVVWLLYCIGYVAAFFVGPLRHTQRRLLTYQEIHTFGERMQLFAWISVLAIAGIYTRAICGFDGCTDWWRSHDTQVEIAATASVMTAMHSAALVFGIGAMIMACVFTTFYHVLFYMARVFVTAVTVVLVWWTGGAGSIAVSFLVLFTGILPLSWALLTPDHANIDYTHRLRPYTADAKYHWLVGDLFSCGRAGRSHKGAKNQRSQILSAT